MGNEGAFSRQSAGADIVGGIVEAAGAIDPLPVDLLPKRHFTAEQIRGGLPPPGPFGVRDLKCWG